MRSCDLKVYDFHNKYIVCENWNRSLTLLKVVCFKKQEQVIHFSCINIG